MSSLNIQKDPRYIQTDIFKVKSKIIWYKHTIAYTIMVLKVQNIDDQKVHSVLICFSTYDRLKFSKTLTQNICFYIRTAPNIFLPSS